MRVRVFMSTWIVVVVAFSFSSCVESKAHLRGSSAVVLVDFSKSFVPLTQDKRALHEVAAATAELSQSKWETPVLLVWSRIQTASLLSAPLCGPFQFEQSLIKSVGTEAVSIGEKMKLCVEATVRASTVSTEHANYTDISGAVALGVQQGSSTNSRNIIVVSDFIEDLPAAKQALPLALNGERVLLLHRKGVDQATLVDHLDLIDDWKERLGRAGASSVVALPLTSVTRSRVVRALDSGVKAGTNVVVLQDLPDTAQPEFLEVISDALIKSARGWSSPVTVTWALVGERSAAPRQMQPEEFIPRLIKTSDLNTSSIDDFSLRLREQAKGMQRFGPGRGTADIAAALRYYDSAGELDMNHVFLIISSFPLVDGAAKVAADLTGAKIVMLVGPNAIDASDQAAYVTRVSEWETQLRQRRATVCRLPLNGLTTSALLQCLQ